MLRRRTNVTIAASADGEALPGRHCGNVLRSRDNLGGHLKVSGLERVCFTRLLEAAFGQL